MVAQGGPTFDEPRRLDLNTAIFRMYFMPSIQLLTSGCRDTQCHETTWIWTQGTVVVPDKRLDTLQEIGDSEKVVPTTVEFVDIAGLVKGASQGEGLGNKFLANIRECDSIVQARSTPVSERSKPDARPNHLGCWRGC